MIYDCDVQMYMYVIVHVRTISVIVIFKYIAVMYMYMICFPVATMQCLFLHHPVGSSAHCHHWAMGTFCCDLWLWTRFQSCGLVWRT